MILTTKLILLVFSFVFLLLASFNIGWPRVNFGWLGLALLVFTFLLK